MVVLEVREWEVERVMQEEVLVVWEAPVEMMGLAVAVEYTKQQAVAVYQSE